jgi:uncharacterized OsmC-like protein
MSDETVHETTLTLGAGYTFTASFDRMPEVPPILLDEPPPVGTGQGPNAAALLATAVGNCLGASLLFCLRKSRADVTGMTVRVAARVARNERGRFRIAGIDVEVAPRLASEEQARLERCAPLFEDFCVVTESVRKGIPVSVAVKTSEGTFSV